MSFQALNTDGILHHEAKEHNQNIITNISIKEKEKKVNKTRVMTTLTNHTNSGVSNVRILYHLKTSSMMT